MAKYDEIGTGYDDTRKADPYIASRIIHYLDVEDGDLCLDVACGTGNYTVAVASQTNAAFCGIDESKYMIEIARNKSPSIQWTIGDVNSMPFKDGHFYRAMCVLAIHHFKDLERALNEVFRVLSRGRFVIFTSDKKQMEGYWLNEYFPEMMRASTAKMPDIEEVSLALKTAGFEDIVTEIYEVKTDLQDWFLYCGKHRPEMYLNPDIRKGSSGFAIFANRGEVEKGLERLSVDIESGMIKEIIESYRNDNGDYLFIAAEKKGSGLKL
jgi:ubiquinone/menaquinone biosynthesis C-methylase UbiE